MWDGSSTRENGFRVFITILFHAHFYESFSRVALTELQGRRHARRSSLSIPALTFGIDVTSWQAAQGGQMSPHGSVAALISKNWIHWIPQMAHSDWQSSCEMLLILLLFQDCYSRQQEDLIKFPRCHGNPRIKYNIGFSLLPSRTCLKMYIS